MRTFIKRHQVLLLIISISINVLAAGYGIHKVMAKREQCKLSQQNEIRHTSPNKWYQYDLLEFSFKGVEARIVFPTQPNQPNQPKYWIWRTQFWGEYPQVDLALLEKGFCLVYVDVIDLYGNKQATTRFNDFYKFMVKNFNLQNKVVLEGLSRGGLDAYNWAAGNTDKVFCIYGDAPVCDIKSWPGGKGKGEGSKEDWNKCLKAYGLTEQTVDTFKNIPVNNCRKIAEAKIPVLHVCGDKDSTVPMDENSYKLAKVFREAGGDIQIIVKKGIGHHPHSLNNPKPVVDFILENTVYKKQPNTNMRNSH